MSKPKMIELTVEEQDALIDRLKNRELTDNDIDIIVGLFSLKSWLISTLKEKNISISRLQTMIFGKPLHKRNKRKKNNKQRNNSDSIGQNETNKQPPNNVTEINKTKKHSKGGRIGHEQYLNKEVINVKHDSFSPGDLCPELCGGRLWNITPGNIIKIKGQGFAKAMHYQIQKLRCSLCGYFISANIPDNVHEDKYDFAFKAQLCMLKYYLGLPFHRIQNYQQLLGIPLPDSTQWDLIEEVANCVYPIFYHLEYLAAQGKLAHLDDTTVKIISNIIENQDNLDKKKRRGTHTTGVISYYKEYQIYLYYSSKNHAGENMADILKQRDSNLPNILYMCDALSRNIPKNTEVELINCLAHCYRKFEEIELVFPEECSFVIEQISLVYKTDLKAKELNLNDNKRLQLHQEHSSKVMSNLKIWLEAQIDNNLIEANNSLGSAIKYTLKHWEPLTKFLRIPGAPLDNNILERSLKIPIRIRKNAMFFKTEHGAFVGSMLLSLIQTCNAANVNPVEYLTALQENKILIFKEPQLWLPWNYNIHYNNQATAAGC